jgi:hypothetical protein
MDHICRGSPTPSVGPGSEKEVSWFLEPWCRTSVAAVLSSSWGCD